MTTDRLVGRSRELERLHVHRERAVGNVLTVVGTAGMGKTRLLREYLAQVPDEWWTRFVSLVELQDDSAVVERVAASCGLKPNGRDDLERICRRLALVEGDGVVLVLDNAEHVQGGVCDVVQGLAALDFVQVLVSSREPLALASEEVFRLASLGDEDGARLLQQVAEPLGVTISDDDAKKLSENLDGLPLALKLAAERTSILSPEQIQERFSQSNRVLRGAGGDRHASLDVALEHSWSTLSREEQQFCVGLAALGFELPVDVAGAIWSGLDVPAIGARLVARSWLEHAEREGTKSYRMLSTIHNFVRTSASSADLESAREKLMNWALARPHDATAWWGCVPEGVLATRLLCERGRSLDAARLVLRLGSVGLAANQARVVVGVAVDLVDALADESDTEQRELRCRLSVLIARQYFGYFGGQDPLYWSKRAIDEAPTKVLRTVSLSLLAIAHAQAYDRAAAEEVAREALEIFAQPVKEADRAEMMSSALNVSAALRGIGMWEESVVAVELAKKLAAGLGRAHYQARCLSHQAFQLFDQARFAACSDTVREAMTLLEGAPAPELYRALNVLPAFDALVRGAYDEAEAYLRAFGAHSEASDAYSRLFFHDRAAADLASLRGQSPYTHLRRAYHKYALLTGDPVANAEGNLLLTLSEIWEGRFEQAIARMEQLLAEEDSRLPGAPEACRQMLRASSRFAKACLLSARGRANANALQPPSSSNAFEEIVDAALAAVEARDPSMLDAYIAACDRSKLTVPGFLLFRFEHQVFGWVRAQLGRHAQVVLRLPHDVLAFEIDGVRFDLSRMPTLRAALRCLVESHERAADDFVSSSDLIHAMWPGVTEVDVTAQNRAYGVIKRLRNSTDIGVHLDSGKKGYRLRQDLRVQWVDKL